jgi:nucleotidyltransferase substrate binding protein (TIGR01987 family)
MKKFENYCSALDVLAEGPKQDLDNTFVQSGIINKFFLQFELGWKLLRALLAVEGDPVSVSGSPRDVIKAAYKYYDFMNETLWLDMLHDRNNTTHVYDQASALALVGRVFSEYLPEFQRLRQGLLDRYGDALLQPDKRDA